MIEVPIAPTATAGNENVIYFFLFARSSGFSYTVITRSVYFDR
ncbi:hypothetical protein BSU04_01245 [Caballeronia sordidicola]|uniref:Uncharacterized protein n=1 Tax=Caballeronia sordidicola TaxID=196367 RepID=A0A226XC06_CABSO|nr:hypothetical protein BSU04_01245 [Caballeronia sordidicola]